jgi:hypothetical protein
MLKEKVPSVFPKRLIYKYLAQSLSIDVADNRLYRQVVKEQRSKMVCLPLCTQSLPMVWLVVGVLQLAIYHCLAFERMAPDTSPFLSIYTVRCSSTKDVLVRS